MAFKSGKLLVATAMVAMFARASSYYMACYFSNWAGYRQGNGKFEPEDIDVNECTHLMYGYGIINNKVSFI